MVPAHAQVRFVDGHIFVGHADSNHLVPIDARSGADSTPTANDPVQLLLIACAGCVGIDVVDYLHTSRKKIRSLVLKVEAVRFPDPPKVIRSLGFHLTVAGDEMNDDLVKRAITVSLTKYCSVSLSLDRSVQFSARAMVNDREVPQWEIARDPAIYSRVT